MLATLSLLRVFLSPRRRRFLCLAPPRVPLGGLALVLMLFVDPIAQARIVGNLHGAVWRHILSKRRIISSAVP
jgi:hypothetical protein